MTLIEKHQNETINHQISKISAASKTTEENIWRKWQLEDEETQKYWKKKENNHHQYRKKR